MLTKLFLCRWLELSAFWAVRWLRYQIRSYILDIYGDKGMITIQATRNGSDVGSLWDQIIVCTITKRNRYNSWHSKSIRKVNFNSNFRFLIPTIGFSTSWCYFAYKSLGWQLFRWYWPALCISYFLIWRHTIVFSRWYWRGSQSLDCGHKSCIETKWSMAWNEHT